MIPRPVYCLHAALVLAACASPAAERVRPYDTMAADSDRQTVRSGQSAPIRLGEAPLFPVDQKRPPAAMTADVEGRTPAAPAPRAIVEEPRPR